MGFYLDRENYFRQLAVQDEDIRHEAVIDMAKPQEIRRSFFAINGLAELLAASKTWIHFPCMVQVAFEGGDLDRDGAIKQSNYTELYFLHKMQTTVQDPEKSIAISRAYDRAFTVMKRVKGVMRAAALVQDCDGPFQRIKSMTWVQDGPIGDGFYGFLLKIVDETED